MTEFGLEAVTRIEPRCTLGDEGKDGETRKSNEELLEENQLLQRELARKEDALARSSEEIHICKRQLDKMSENLSNSQEMNMLAEENIEEIIESLENLRTKIEQLQLHCEKLTQNKLQLEQNLINKEEEHQTAIAKLHEEVTFLRKVNLQLLARKSTDAAEHQELPEWLKNVMDAEETRKKVVALEAKISGQQISNMEKDKVISSLEWQVMDSEATIATLQAERDKLAIELDAMIIRDQEGGLGGWATLFEDDAVDQKYSSRDSLEGSDLRDFDHGAYHADEELDGYECGTDDRPKLRSKRRHCRHLSDLRKERTAEEIHMKRLRNRSLSDCEGLDCMGTESSGFSGGLKRTANFSNINDVDDLSSYQLERQSMQSDSASDVAGLSMERINSALWDNIKNGKPNEISEWKEINKGLEQLLSQNSPPRQSWELPEPDEFYEGEGEGDDVFVTTRSNKPLGDSRPNSFDQESCDSGVASKDPSACCSDHSDSSGKSPGLDGLKLTEDGKDSALRNSTGGLSDLSAQDETVSADLWSFTPDSIIDVSTGESLDGSPRVKRQAENLKSSPDSSLHASGVSKYDLPRMVVSPCTLNPESVGRKMPTHDEKAFSVLSVNRPLVAPPFHERTVSEPADMSLLLDQGLDGRPSGKQEEKRKQKLQAYQVWKMTGRQGEPPGHLKISKC